MFSSLGFFSQLECPGQSQCKLPNCIFSHFSKDQSSNSSTNALSRQSLKSDEMPTSDASDFGSARKKRRISCEFEQGQSGEPLLMKNTTLQESQRSIKEKPNLATNRSQGSSIRSEIPESATRAASPPSLQNIRESNKSAKSETKAPVKGDEQKKTKSNVKKSTKELIEPLNPRVCLDFLYHEMY